MTGERREMGDWQTPTDFAAACCNLVRDRFSYTPRLIVEPTCGEGNFIQAARDEFPDARITGLELNPIHVATARNRFSGDGSVTVMEGDVLKDDASRLFTTRSSVLVLGNPPWVTNTELSSINSTNLPEKRNVKKLRGLDAMTGESNFDICEWIILRMLENLKTVEDGMLAMLCKTSVARNVCVEAVRRNYRVSCTMIRFDSRRVFNVNAAACLLVCDFRSGDRGIRECDITDPDDVTGLEYVDGRLSVLLPDDLVDLRGVSQLEWRQGVKHDCSRIMELTVRDGRCVNRLGETVDIEKEYVYPYVKSSMSRRYLIDSSPMMIPMTQHRIGEDTGHLKTDAPRFWSYLTEHHELLDGRKSSIYRNAPRFAMFGVGDYSFAPYKVGVSGFYKTPVFSLSTGGKPVMYDDTCYFLPFDDLGAARVCMLLLNSEDVQRYYRMTAYLDGKRPFTKKLLSRLDFRKALEHTDVKGLNRVARRLEVPFRVTDPDVERFSALIGDRTADPVLFP